MKRLLLLLSLLFLLLPAAPAKAQTATLYFPPLTGNT